MGFLDFWFGSKPTEKTRLHPGRGWTVEVVGESNFQSAIAGHYRRSGGVDSDLKCEAELVPEPTNPHDENAIPVQIGGLTVGYLPRDRAKEYRAQIAKLPQLNAAISCSAKIVGGHQLEDGEPAHFGVKLNVSWPPRLA